jgi:hypothetical protein
MMQKSTNPLDKLGTYQVPEYAMPYLMHGDTDDLSDEDQAAIDKWLADSFFVTHKWLTFEVMDVNTAFTIVPAFGLPTTTMEVAVYGHWRNANPDNPA